MERTVTAKQPTFKFKSIYKSLNDLKSLAVVYPENQKNEF